MLKEDSDKLESATEIIKNWFSNYVSNSIIVLKIDISNITSESMDKVYYIGEKIESGN